MHLVTYLEFLQQSEEALGRTYRLVADGHAADADVHFATARFATHCADHVREIAAVLQGRAPATEPPPERLHVRAPEAHRPGPIGLLRDLQELYQLASLTDITWDLIGRAAHGARDAGLLTLVDHCAPDTAVQLAWLRTRMEAAAPQTLLVAP